MVVYKVELCGVNTSSLPLLKNEEKDELLRKAIDGDSKAREKYIKGNLRLVLSVIQRFAGNGENADDLFQIGCIGLMKAIDNFDVTQNVRFSTYAVPMIMGEVRRYMRDYNSIRVSRSLRDTAYKAIHARDMLTKRTSMSRPLWRLLPKSDFQKKRLSWHLTQYRRRFLCMNRYSPRAVTHCM